MKLLAISDIGDLNWNYGHIKADILISCGDVSDEVILARILYEKCDFVNLLKRKQSDMY